MAKTTPGPWIVEHLFNVKAGRRGVASCGGYSSNVDSEKTHFENIANAKLIAAAPDLLEALKNVLSFFPYTHIDPDTPEGCAYHIAKALIAKVEGREDE